MEVIFKDFVYDETKSLTENENGHILCTVSDFEGKEEYAFLDKEMLIASNLLPKEEKNKPSSSKLAYNLLPKEKKDTPSTSKSVDEESIEWSDDMTRMILDNYSEYKSEVGPMKQFRTKKKMWEHIANELDEKFKNTRTAQQVENRFKTVLKRKKKAVDNNTRSGSQRKTIEFEQELSKIANADDSIEPEVLKDQTQTTINIRTDVKGKKRQTLGLAEVFKETQEKKLKLQEQQHSQKEENKERRHAEKLQLLKELFSK